MEDDPDLSEMLVQGYESDKKMKVIIQRLSDAAEESLRQSYSWNASSKRLHYKDDPHWRLCIPQGPLRQKLLYLNHSAASAGHPGRDKTYSRLSRLYYWPGMRRDVAKYVKTCDCCQRSKGNQPRESIIQHLPIPGKPWSDIGMDFITGLPMTSQGHDTILTFVDRLTKQAHFVATRATIDAVETSELYFQTVYRLHGLSRSIVSDRDPRFTAEVYRNIFNHLGVSLNFSTANHPQTDGQTERVHQIIEQILRTSVNHRQTNWEEVLPICEFAYNDMLQESTCETPFYLNHGHHPISAADVLIDISNAPPPAHDWLEKKSIALKQARDSIQSAIDRQASYANRSRRVRPFTQGEMVMVHKDYMSTPASRSQPCSKLRPKWFGPFKILEVLSSSTVRLNLPHYCRAHPVFNVSAIKPYHSDPTSTADPPPLPLIDLDGHERYIVSEVLNQRMYRGRKQYLVKWEGYADPTWEPEAYLMDESGSPIAPLRQYMSTLVGG